MTDLTTIDLTAVIDTHLEAYALPDQGRRAELIAQVWATEGELIDPPFEGKGHAEISGMADTVNEHYAGHTFRRTSAVDAHHDVARYTWELVAPDGTVAVGGTDIAQLNDEGKLVKILGFFGDPPAA